MFVSFFESFKYTGHLWPVALLRVYAGLMFLKGERQQNPSSIICRNQLSRRSSSNGFSQAGTTKLMFTFYKRSYSRTGNFDYLVVTGELAVGLCFIVGFMVRPAAIVAVFLNYNFMMAGSPATVVIDKLFIAISLCLFFSAAGRCFGFDYYFDKKIRGFWW